MRRRGGRLLTAAVAALAAAGALLLCRGTTRAEWSGSPAPVALDFARPDLLVRTRSLSALPRDVLRVPLLRDLLTEDLVFYYQEHPDRLGLLGSLRRIAYEHDLTWKDEVLSWALDEPAELALWRGPAGSLEYWAVAMDRPRLAAVLQEAATAALNDKQLERAGRLEVDGAEVEVLALAVSPRRTLMLAAREQRVVVLSHPGMLFDGGAFIPAAREAVTALLSADARGRAVLQRGLELPDTATTHSLVARASWLSFGYQRFFPGLEALRFDLGEGGWSTAALFDGTQAPAHTFADGALWKVVPANPALCALLPVQWSEGRAFAEGEPARVANSLAKLAGELEGPAAVCWYGEGRLQTPLVVATLKEKHAPADLALSTVFNWGVTHGKGADPVRGKPAPGSGRLWELEVDDVPFAATDEAGRPVPGPLTVTLARAGRYVVFSPDRDRVQRALETQDRRYPSLAERLPEEGVTLGLLVPRTVGVMGRREALTMLPRAEEPVFRTAAERLLLPRLETLGRYPAYRLAVAAVPAGARAWQDVAWQEMK